MSHTFHFLLSTNIISAMQKKTLGTTPRLGSAGGLLTHTIMGEVQDSNNTITDKQSILLQKQRQLQTMHSNQHQKLLHKQKKDWEWFHANYLGENRLEELQTIHQKETMELLIRHQREQDEMISFWGKCC